jgi:hypothetical protein
VNFVIGNRLEPLAIPWRIRPRLQQARRQIKIIARPRIAMPAHAPSTLPPKMISRNGPMHSAIIRQLRTV